MKPLILLDCVLFFFFCFIFSVMGHPAETFILAFLGIALVGGFASFIVGMPLGVIASFGNFTETTSVVFYPTRWPFYIFVLVLIGTVDREYFPTAGLITVYFAIMLYYGQFKFATDFMNIVWFVVGAAVWLIVGAVWLYVKWWSYLRDPKNSNQIKSIADGKESEFFLSRLPYLYPHFLYWPFSIPHTLISKLVFQVFEEVARRWQGTFAKMVITRKTELNAAVAQ